MVKKSFETDDENTKASINASLQSSAVVKILINFNQIFAILNNYNFSYADYFKQFFDIFQNSVPTIVNGFSANCFLVMDQVNKNDIFYINYIIYLIQPIFIFVVTGLIAYLSYRKTRHDPFKSFDLKKRLLNLALIIFYIFQPNILSKTLGLY